MRKALQQGVDDARAELKTLGAGIWVPTKFFGTCAKIGTDYTNRALRPTGSGHGRAVVEVATGAGMSVAKYLGRNLCMFVPPFVKGG
jgi:hypothetical protein